jgi:pimeloyl-ACP methyl ester carboxylesterase
MPADFEPRDPLPSSTWPAAAPDVPDAARDSHSRFAAPIKLGTKLSIDTGSCRLSIAGHSVREEPDGRFGYKFDPGWFSLPSKPQPNPESVTCRTLLLRGEQSHLLSPEAARDFVNQLPNGQLVEIPNAGHHLFLDQPKRSLDLLLAFLSPPADKISLNA